ncbi:M1 family aminopeptidase [Neolewinella agarilytica]|uniref:Aminopeptidase N n=1 Tax=Neolewinella agarilytica TaxID=478744 RepID=A0A1H9AAJ1_9BACT|nr:M1 family aminopeptidase [Neolewinella agarilytica]SEP73766.1 aminopeptidase N [Neolewinella agarilytica]
MRNTFSLIGLLATLFAVGCSTTKPATVEAPVVMEVRDLDTMTITPEANGVTDMQAEIEIPNERPVYRPAYFRTHDLLHTRLDLRFDWAKEQVIGKATLKLTPYFRPSAKLVLDAKGFEFKSIKMASGKELSYDYGGEKQQVTIALDRQYKRGEEYTIVIDYTAIPAESGGSAAITSDKGLFFINPRGEEGDKPRQIWTQGETENNSRWFPTIDKPNERTTQEMYVTVADEYETLSNGSLINQTKNADGTRTDYWKMDLPHAPYLFALIVGDFDIVEDQDWNGIPVNYYMEKGWKDHAKDIYPYTREMLSFFSDVTGVSYPWPKYSQVAVRDYVSGAMENTSAVIFGEFMHGTKRDLIDVETNEKIVAHEMFHHWFGDYVTCESWSNLTLNEGFANYSEYLWMEEKHGRDAADFHMLNERSGYFGSVNRGEPHELIWYDYDDKEDMFDAHSYNKGGAVLHMLRHYVGDDAFFTSLKHYLTENQYSAVEVDELRMAFEETTGEDLNWFFDQWFLKAGHPALSLDTDYADGKVTLTVEQTQETEHNVPAIFRIPVEVDIYTNGSTTPNRQIITVDQRKQTFTFDSPVKPDVVIFDPNHQLLAQFNYIKSAEELAAQFKAAPNLIDRYLVLQRLSTKEESDAKTQTLTAALKDPFHAVRGLAMRTISEPTPDQIALVRMLAEGDPHSAVRAAAIEMFAEVGGDNVKTVAESALNAEPYPVVAAGLQALVSVDPKAAAAAASQLESIENDDIAGALAELYAGLGDVSKLPYFEKRMNEVDGYGALNLMDGYRNLLAKGSPDQMAAGVAKLKSLGLDQGGSPWRRLAATKAINDIRESLKKAGAANPMIEQLKIMIDEIKAKETVSDLRQIYEGYGQ